MIDLCELRSDDVARWMMIPLIAYKLSGDVDPSTVDRLAADLSRFLVWIEKEEEA